MSGWCRVTARPRLCHTSHFTSRPRHGPARKIFPFELRGVPYIYIRSRQNKKDVGELPLSLQENVVDKVVSVVSLYLYLVGKRRRMTKLCEHWYIDHIYSLGVKMSVAHWVITLGIPTNNTLQQFMLICA